MSNGVDFKKIALENQDLLNAALAREAALREELAALRESYEAMRDRKNSIVDLQQRLTFEERRAGDLETALINVRETLGREYWDQYAGLDETRDILDAALKPAAGSLCD